MNVSTPFFPLASELHFDSSNLNQTNSNAHLDWQSTNYDLPFQVEMNRLNVSNGRLIDLIQEETSQGRHSLLFKVYTYRLKFIFSTYIDPDNWKLKLYDVNNSKTIKKALIIKNSIIKGNSLTIDFIFNSKVTITSFPNRTKEVNPFKCRLKTRTEIAGKITSLFESEKFIVKKQLNSGRYKAEVSENGLLTRETKKRKILETASNKQKTRFVIENGNQKLESESSNEEDKDLQKLSHTRTLTEKSSERIDSNEEIPTKNGSFSNTNLANNFDNPTSTIDLRLSHIFNENLNLSFNLDCLPANQSQFFDLNIEDGLESNLSFNFNEAFISPEFDTLNLIDQKSVKLDMMIATNHYNHR